MASISDYASLKDAVADWLWRTGDTALTDRADAFVQLFEAEFVGNPENRFTDMEETDSALITSAALPLPDGYLEMIDLKSVGAAISVSDQSLDYITPREASRIESAQCAPSVVTKYTVKSGQIFLTPASAAPIGASLEMTYYKFAPLSDTNTTNWLLEKYPNLYLYGALMQAAAFIDDKQTVGFWGGMLSKAQANLPLANRKAKVGAGPLQMTPSTGFRK